jgi:two-component system sensor histidine kinase YesM
MGNNIASYIEVQKPASILEDIFSLNQKGTFQIAVINGRGDVFFSQFSDAQNAALIKDLTDDPRLREQPLNHIEKNFAASYYSSYTDTYTIVMQGTESMALAVRDVTLVTIIIALLIGLASILVISIMSIRVTLPIQHLITKMEATNLDNLDRDAARDMALERTVEANAGGSDDEFVHLYRSYNDLLKRLNNAMLQEEQMELLHLQAEFDALQAQVNPHFLNNVLNVISHRGVLNGDELICGICEKLAAMLRYAAGTSQRLVTIREELEYLKDYLYLLGTRYRSKLEYTIDVEGEVMEQMIPKIVLQQLIENSVTHGYTNALDIMSISVRGRIESEHWYVEVADNGRGFTKEEKQALEQKMGEIQERVAGGKLNLDLGGMGLLNMYARFLILFGEGAVFRISNGQAGASVVIGAPKIRSREFHSPQTVFVRG